jgi:hypothetical protein
VVATAESKAAIIRGARACVFFPFFPFDAAMVRLAGARPLKIDGA